MSEPQSAKTDGKTDGEQAPVGITHETFHVDLIPGVEARALPLGVDDDVDVLKWRRSIGYAIGAVAILGVAAMLAFSMWSLHEMAPPDDGQEIYGYVMLGAHAVLMIAAVWFCYQLLRAAERMVLPYWWVRFNTDAVRMMLGITDPWRSALKAGEEILEVGTKAAGAIGTIAGSALPKKE
jgi:hypothetical protein